MSSICPTCKRSSIIGGGYSNRTRATKFTPTGKVRKYVNLQWARIPSGGRVKICTRCLKANKHLSLKSPAKPKPLVTKSK